MAGETGAVCSACDTPVGDPEKELADPDDPDAPEDAHFVIQKRSDGELRAQCTKTGQLASVLAGGNKINPINGDVTGTVEPEGDRRNREEEENKSPESTQTPRRPDEVYDIEPDRDQEDVLMEVVTNESYGLSNEQVKELKSWSEDYDGQMPPDAVQEVLSLMNGINKQTAKLVRERYELRLNRWIRDQNTDDNSPTLGLSSQRGVKQRRSSPGRPGGHPRPEPNGRTGPDPDPDDNDLEQEDSSRMEARQRRRNRAVDKAVDEFADQFAKNLASDAGSFFSDARDIARTLLKKKAEKDPDWFFEKMEQYDMELVDTVLEPSEQRKEELGAGGGGSTEVDSEIDAALEDMGGSSSPSQEQSQTDYTPVQMGHDPLSASPDQPDDTGTPNNPPPVSEDEQQGQDGSEETQAEEDEFEEIFG